MSDQYTPEELPPSPFQSWEQLYLAVIVVLVLVVLCFFLFTLRFHPV